MPLYEYQCECGSEGEFILPLNTRPPTCKCGRVMQIKVSLSSFTLKPYARHMALDSLNARGGGFPDANEHKSWVQQKAFEGVG